MAEIITDKLCHVYSKDTPFEKTAIRDISLTIPQGQLAALIGHTGSGKSTFIQHLNALLQPTTGRVLLDGEDINRDKFCSPPRAGCCWTGRTSTATNTPGAT